MARPDQRDDDEDDLTEQELLEEAKEEAAVDNEIGPDADPAEGYVFEVVDKDDDPHIALVVYDERMRWYLGSTYFRSYLSAKKVLKHVLRSRAKRLRMLSKRCVRWDVDAIRVPTIDDDGEMEKPKREEA